MGKQCKREAQHCCDQHAKFPKSHQLHVGPQGQVWHSGLDLIMLQVNTPQKREKLLPANWLNPKCLSPRPCWEREDYKKGSVSAWTWSHIYPGWKRSG